MMEGSTEAPPEWAELLRALAAEIAAGDYRDALGHRLTLNTAFLAAAAALMLEDSLEQPR